MLLIGCKPKGRHTEQHDVFFTIGKDLKSIIPSVKAFWPDAGTIHIDAWRMVTEVNGNKIEIVNKNVADLNSKKLFFLNLGGYQPGEFEEYHYKMVVAAEQKSIAIKEAKSTAFFKHNSFKGALSHIDDKYGIDVDDIYQIEDILPLEQKAIFSIKISNAVKPKVDDWHIGYLNISKIK
jgi:hypothetical protein